MRKFEYAWVILGTAVLMLFFNAGSLFALGLVLKPMSEELGWSRSETSLAFTLFMVVSAVAMPVFGRIIDRYGPRWVFVFSIILASVGIGLMALVQSLWQAYLLYGVVFAIGSAGTSVAPVGVMVSRWFAKRMGMANSTAIGGYALGQLVIIGLLASFLESTGWQWTFGILGIINLAIVLPVVLITVRANRKPPAEEEAPLMAGHHAMPTKQGVLPPVELLKSPKLWLLAGVYAICGFQDFFVATHVVAFADDSGLGTKLSGNLLALMGLMGLAGVMATGWFTDKFGPMWPTALCFVFRILIFAIALFFQNTPGILLFALLYGSTFLITAPLVMVYAARVFGRAHLGTVAGLISLVHQLCGGLGAFVGGWFYDQALNYDGVFVVVLVLSAVAVPVTLAIGKARVQPAVVAKL
ncbi:MAG: MFS transporter [Chloroflexi bacterium]|nr:MFS transporter [Chloroflexota bacterium]